MTNPEFSSTAEAPADTSSDKKQTGDKTKKRLTGKKAIQAEVVAENTRKKSDQREAFNPFAQKPKQEKGTEKKPEVPLFGIAKPEMTPPSPDIAAKTGELGATARPGGTETPIKSNEQPSDEQKSRDILDAAAKKMAAEHLQAADAELHEVTPDSADTPKAAEAAAAAALLHEVRDSLNDHHNHQPNETTEDRLQQALDEAERHIAAELNLDNEAHQAVEAQEETEPGPEADAEDIEVAAAEADTEVSHDESAPLPPSAGMPPGQGPPIPPGPPRPPFGPHGSGMPFGPGGPPYGPDRFAMYSPATAAEPASANMMPVVDALHNERVAQGRGLVVGGVVGYFLGRRKGRRQGRKQESKRSAPKIRSLEQRANNLEEMFAAKERQVRQAASEKMHLMKQSKDRKRMIDGLTRQAELQPVAAAKAETAMQSRPISPVEAAAAVSAAAAVGRAEAGPFQRVASAERPAGELYSRRGESLLAFPQSSEVLIGQRYHHEISPAEQSQIVRFDKKAEDFSREELMQTAEKIKIQGVSLKEMVQLGSIDERSLRRVVGEFLEGGDVSAAVANEMKEKELKYERDPRMRMAAGAGGPSDNASAASDNSIVTGSDAQNTSSITQDTSGPLDMTNNSRKPVPDAATLAAIRNRQAATLAGTLLVVATLIVLAIFLAG